ncbi:MAG: 16S rRNA (uracil(1498)-N(3))-methyltransferase [Clostridia bacterium]|nr:16S rRNA (uracil(1498)-N(3))-methyltransferase [Clostridia bacterium]
MAAHPRLFIPQDQARSALSAGFVLITGPDVNHVKNVLRLPAGSVLTVGDGEGTFFLARIREYSKEGLIADVLPDSAVEADTEFPFGVTLYQCLPKGEKTDWIVQKAVELGATEIVFVFSERCVARPDANAMEKKIARMQRIAESASSQSGRGVIPAVRGPLSYADAVEEMKSASHPFVCYEGLDVLPLPSLLTGLPERVAFLIGPEGGLSERETALAREAGIPLAGLGKRILRTETAPLFVLSCLGYRYGL